MEHINGGRSKKDVDPAGFRSEFLAYWAVIPRISDEAEAEADEEENYS